MRDESRKLKYPKLAWNRATTVWYVSAITILSVVLWILSDVPLIKRVIIASLIVLLPVVLWILCYLSQWTAVFIKRSNQFDTFAGQISALNTELISAKQTIFSLLREKHNSRRAHYIDYCYTYNEEACLVLFKKTGAKQPLQSQVAVVETEYDEVIGYFRIISEDAKHYLCKQNGFVDALWLGNIKQSGSQPSKASPTAVAYIISNTTGDGNE